MNGDYDKEVSSESFDNYDEGARLIANRGTAVAIFKSSSGEVRGELIVFLDKILSAAETETEDTLAHNFLPKSETDKYDELYEWLDDQDINTLQDFKKLIQK